MSFIEHIDKQIKEGEISNKEALELKMHYHSLSPEEQSDMDSKYESVVKKDKSLKSDNESFNKKSISATKEIKKIQLEKSKKSNFFVRYLTYNNEYISGKTYYLRHLFILTLFIPFLGILLFPFVSYFIIISTYKRAKSLEWDSVLVMLSVIGMFCFPIITYIIFYIYLIVDPVPLLAPFLTTIIYFIFSSSLIYLNGNPYFRKKEKKEFFNKINELSNNDLIELVSGKHLSFDELIENGLSNDKKEFLMKKLYSNINLHKLVEVNDLKISQSWICNKCNEEVDAGFDVCWNCS